MDNKEISMDGKVKIKFEPAIVKIRDYDAPLMG
jgi:hypothetical protein